MDDNYNRINDQVHESVKHLFEYQLMKLVGQVKNDEDHSKTFDLIITTFNNTVDSNKRMLARASTSL